MNRIETNELQRDRARDSERPGQPQHPSCVSWSQEPSFESLEVNGLNIMPEVCSQIKVIPGVSCQCHDIFTVMVVEPD